MNLNKVVGSFINLPSQSPSTEECDVIEIRLDADLPEKELSAFLASTSQEKLFTFRDYAEGGSFSSSQIPVNERMRGLENHLQEADYIDIELRNWESMSEVIEKAREHGCPVIGSRHDFHGTPYEEIEELVAFAQEHKVDILKFAFTPHDLEDIKLYQDLLFKHQEMNISIMGMGVYAPISRVLLAQSGSVLNYGFLGDHVTAPGQWSARLLREAIHASAPISVR